MKKLWRCFILFIYRRIVISLAKRKFNRLMKLYGGKHIGHHVGEVVLHFNDRDSLPYTLFPPTIDHDLLYMARNEIHDFSLRSIDVTYFNSLNLYKVKVNYGINGTLNYLAKQCV